MTDLFDSIKRGLEEAIAHSSGKQTGVRVYSPHPVDVKQVRARTGLTQNQFAQTFGISVATLRHWERGDRTPQGPALVLLNAAQNDPVGLLRILARSSSAEGGESRIVIPSTGKKGGRNDSPAPRRKTRQVTK